MSRQRKARRFKDLEISEKAHELVLKPYKITKDLSSTIYIKTMIGEKIWY